MISVEYNDIAALPKDLEGWKARAEYFESLFKIEKLTSAKLRLIKGPTCCLRLELHRNLLFDNRSDVK